jgi:RNA polymerase sigma-B factor
MPIPSDRELAELIQGLPAGDARRDAACEILVSRYQRIVSSCVRRYRASPEPTEDLIQSGYVGLMKAINGFDPALGDDLAAYAQVCVSGELKRHFRDRRWQIRPQRRTQELRLRVRSVTEELTQALSHSPTDAELADRLDVTEAEVTEARLAAQGMQADSLDAPADSGDDRRGSVGDKLGAEDARLEQLLDMEAVWHHCAELPARQQRLLTLRFFGNMTQTEIARELGISQMHVSRLQRRALTYLREKVASPVP